MKRITVILALAALPAVAACPRGSFAFKNATVITVSGPTLHAANVVVCDGLIAAVGADAAIPVDAQVVDATGLTIFPGLVDGFSQYGLPAPASASRGGARPDGAQQEAAQARAIASTLDGIPVNDPRRYIDPEPAGVHADRVAAQLLAPPASLTAVRDSGVLASLVAPADGIFKGEAAVVNLVGPDGAAMLVVPHAGQVFELRPAGFGSYPTSVMGAVAVFRQTLLDAQRLHTELGIFHQANGKSLPPPNYDPQTLALQPTLNRQEPANYFVASDWDAILRALSLAHEFQLEPTIIGATDAAHAVAELKAAHARVLLSLGFAAPAVSIGLGGGPRRPSPAEAARERAEAEAAAAALAKAGIPFGFATYGMPATDSVFGQVRQAMAHGLSEADAWHALTLGAASIVGSANQLGSIEAGKVANLVAASADPLASASAVNQWIMVAGQLHPVHVPAVTRMARSRAPASTDANAEASAQLAANLPPPGPGAAPGDLFIADATVMTASHGTLPHTSILVRAGKIAAIGSKLIAPAGIRTIAGAGLVVTPGIIDEHSHTAVDGGVNEGAPSISAMTRIKDVINPHDINLYRQLAGGVTTIHIFHGSANEIGGEDAVLKLKWGLPVDQMLYPGAPQGIKFALGENPKQTANPHGRYPATRQGVNDAIRTAFLHAQAYKKQWDDYHAAVARGEQVYPPRTDLNLEPLVGILEGKILVHSHSYVSQEMQGLIDLSDEFHFHIASLEHCLEAYRLVNEIKSHDIGCSTFADSWSYKMEAINGIAYNAALLEQKGVRAAINSDDDERARRLYQDAAKVIHYGDVSEQTALQTITLNPAWMLGIDKTVGSIDVGKDADFAVFNGNPFGPNARVEKTIIDGQVFFDRGDGDAAAAVAPAPAPVPNAPITFPQRGTIAIVGARIVPVSGPVLASGTIVLNDGAIAALGARVAVPKGAQIINGRGLSVYPGMMDGSTTLGIAEVTGHAPGTVDTNELGDFNPQLISSVAVNPGSDIIGTVRANGVTSALVAMRGGLIPAQASIIDLGIYTNDQMSVRRTAALWINLPGPGGRGGFGGQGEGNADKAAIEARMQSLRDYLAAARRYAPVANRVAEPDPAMAAMVPYVSGRAPVIIGASTEEQIKAAIAFGKAEHLKLILAGARDAWKVIPEIKESGYAVLYGPVTEMPGADDDPYDAVYTTPAKLATAGIPFALITGSAAESRNLPYNAALAEAYGLAPDAALRAITLAPAQILGVDDQLGSLEVGKRANLFLATGDPIDPRSQVEAVYVDGQLMPLSKHEQLYRQWLARPDQNPAPYRAPRRP